MPVLRFRVYWEEDDLVYRDIEIPGSNNFRALHEAILKSYDFDQKHEATFFESNDRWHRGRGISSEVMVNKRDAPELSMVKTPISALIIAPDQQFVYEYDRQRQWVFLVQLISMEKEEDPRKTYPLIARKEGIGPSQYGVKGAPVAGVERSMEVVEAYDLGAEEMAEGFGNEGEEGGGAEESYTDAGSDGGFDE